MALCARLKYHRSTGFILYMIVRFVCTLVVRPSLNINFLTVCPFFKYFGAIECCPPAEADAPNLSVTAVDYMIRDAAPVNYLKTNFTDGVCFAYQGVELGCGEPRSRS